MKRFVLLIATLMLGGAALAQDTTYGDPSMTPDTAVTSDTSVAPDTSVDTTATTDATTSSATTTGEPAATGVNAPYEAAPTTMAMNAPTSKGGYTACDPGPGDDSCIQLYESGVSARTNLALNDSLPGGSETMMASATTSPTPAATGVGGPYEPIGATTGATSSQSDYPPCSGSPGDDRCIQLYERGVTGSDN